MKVKSLVLPLLLFITMCVWVHAQEAATPAATPQLTKAEERQQKEVKEAGKKFSSGWWEKLKHGGWTAAVQIGVSVFGAGFVVERFFNLRRERIAPKGLSAKARQLWREGRFAEIETLAAKDRSTLAKVIAYVVQHRNNSFADISVGAGDIAAADLSEHYERAYPLGIVATLEPLLGLLGMILGMIQTFEIVAMAGALGDPSQLASGISEALVTTGLGLAVAIPFLALYHYFKTQTTKLGTMVEKEVTALTSEWLLKQEVSGAA